MAKDDSPLYDSSESLQLLDDGILATPAASSPEGLDVLDALQSGAARAPWKVLIVDDEDEVHSLTRLVLADYHFDGRSLEFISAYSGGEAREILRGHPDVALILLDVVMESDDAGLLLARHVREELGNRLVRIILRTGQPGQAPESKVIAEYDINDYKEKTELTASKLFTTVTVALRGFRDMRTIEQNRKGLEQILDASKGLFEIRSFRDFSTGLLVQLTQILHYDLEVGSAAASGFSALRDEQGYRLLAGTGRFESLLGELAREVLPTGDRRLVERAVQEQGSQFSESRYADYFKARDGSESVLYLESRQPIGRLDRDLIQVFSNNMTVAFDNINLSHEIVDTQKEVIIVLGELVETKSNEAANHVRRVAEYSGILAQMAGLDPDDAMLLQLASPMHDVGKIGISDTILNKPGRLTNEEFDTIKTHTTIGYDILRNSGRPIMQAAAIVAHQHHERWDGKGYPRGLAGEDIHVFGRITAIADVFDALICKRVYKAAWPLERIVKLFEEEQGKQFDPKLMGLFLANVDDFVAILETFPD